MFLVEDMYISSPLDAMYKWNQQKFKKLHEF
jgi:hypothetical protein